MHISESDANFISFEIFTLLETSQKWELTLQISWQFWILLPTEWENFLSVPMHFWIQWHQKQKFQTEPWCDSLRHLRVIYRSFWQISFAANKMEMNGNRKCAVSQKKSVQQAHGFWHKNAEKGEHAYVDRKSLISSFWPHVEWKNLRHFFTTFDQKIKLQKIHANLPNFLAQNWKLSMTQQWTLKHKWCIVCCKNCIFLSCFHAVTCGSFYKLLLHAWHHGVTPNIFSVFNFMCLLWWPLLSVYLQQSPMIFHGLHVSPSNGDKLGQFTNVSYNFTWKSMCYHLLCCDGSASN